MKRALLTGLRCGKEAHWRRKQWLLRKRHHLSVQRRNCKIQSSAELKLAKDMKGNKKSFLCMCLETVTNVSLGPVTTQQVCCDEAGSRSSQETKPAGQDQGGTRLGTDTAPAQLQCQTQEPQLESSSQGTERQAGRPLLWLPPAFFPTNISDQQKGCPCTW